MKLRKEKILKLKKPKTKHDEQAKPTVAKPQLMKIVDYSKNDDVQNF